MSAPVLRRPPPPILRAQPVALQIPAQAYAHCWLLANGADRVPGLADRVDGGAAPSGRVGRQGEAARLLGRFEQAIGQGTVALGRRGRDGPAVVIAERDLVRAVAISHVDLVGLCKALTLAPSGRRRGVLSAAFVAALRRMRVVDGIDRIFD